MRLSARSPLAIAAIAVLGVVLLVVLTLTFLDWNLLKGPLTRTASARFGREVGITGPLQVHLWSRHPTVIVNGLIIGGPPWERDRPVARIERLQIELEPLRSLMKAALILGRVELVHPEIYLHTEKSGRANWTFENRAPSKQRASPPLTLPTMHDLVIDDGKLDLIDERRRLKVKGTVEAAQRAAPRDQKPFRVEGKGTINDEPFRLDVAGGPLQVLSPYRPYPFALAIRAGENEIHADGKVLKPFDLGALELRVSASGPDLAQMFYLTQITLPNSPPYKVQASIKREGMRIAVRQIEGSLGGSDVTGTVDIDATTKRPTVKADLLSRHLFLKDFAAVTGSRANPNTSLANGAPGGGAQADGKTARADAKAARADRVPHLFPTARLQIERVRAIDADVHFRATSIEAGRVPFTQLVLHARLRDGVLSLDPLRFDMAQGRLRADVHIDARSQPPVVRADLRAADVQLGQFKGKAQASPPLDGVLDARALIEGNGDSVHALMSDASGRLTVIVPKGDVRAAFAELTGIDIAKGIGLLVQKPDEKEQIRCGVAEFNVETGTAHAQDLLFDTQDVLIKGEGQINLGNEKLDLTIRGQPKKLRLFRVRAPIEVGGELLKPSFRLKPGPLVAQGAAGAVLGTLLTPVGAILAFVDPGLAKNQDCSQLLTQARQSEPGSAASSRTAQAQPADPRR
ncbi:MAG TPA: AsmA family protein [Steroidobacteraceae bacterium]|nr:AsmA family protein [Steroidobacteraceae bacterium]